MKRLFDYGFLSEFQKDFCKLLSRFEIAIPIDESRLFFPSLLPTHSQFHYFYLNYSFPGKNIDKIKAEMHKNYLNLDGRQTSECIQNNVVLIPTGLCYRRYFALTVMPIPLWPRLISRCLTTSKFLEIIRQNCIKSLAFHVFQDLGKAGVGNSILEWVYWRNGIELRLCRMTVLQISNVDLTSSSCSAESTENVSAHENIRNIQINTGSEWIKLPMCFTGGIEVVVPECIILSIGIENEHNISSFFSAQIFTHCVEVIDEIFMEWFTTSKTGNSAHAISKYLICFTPCPICLGNKDQRKVIDTKPESSLELPPTGGEFINQDLTASVNFDLSSRPSNAGSFASWFTKKTKDCNDILGRKFSIRYIDASDACSSGDPVGFTAKHCLWIAQAQNFVTCPVHGQLSLKHLTPDLVSCVNIIVMLLNSDM